MENLTNKELKKLIKIEGVERIKYLYIYGKIKLTSKQLDEIIEGENNDERKDNIK